MKITDRQLAMWVYRQRENCDDPRRRALLEKIPGWTWDALIAKWEEGFRQIQKHGVVSSAFITKDGYKLGQWIDVQRRECEDSDRRNRLESIPDWSWDARESAWEEGFAQLKKYGVVVRNFKTKDGFKLAGWIHNQRHRCNDPDRRKRLESIPGWEWNPYESAWEEGFKQLQKHGVVSKEFVGDGGFRLGNWINKQRARCKDPKHRKRLESVPGWTWDARESAWEEGFKQLKKHGIVSQKFTTKDGYKLGIWIDTQRQACKNPERRKRLESVPGWTWYPSNAKARRKN